MAKSILYTLSTGEFVIDDQFTGENNATTITIDYSDCEVDTWSKYLDIRLPDGSGAPLFLGSDIAVTLELDASFTAFKGKIEIQPYAIEAVTSNKILWDIKPITIQRSLSVAEDDIAYDPTAMQQLLDAIATMQAKINLIYTDYENGVFNGTDGVDGTNGIDGVDGTAITSVTSKKVGDVTTVTIKGTFVGAPYIFTIDDGIDGINGIDGIDGTTITSITTEKVGTTTTVTITGTFPDSPKVFTIEDGIDGTNGTNGIDGIDGTNVESVTSNKVGTTTTVTITGTFTGSPYEFAIEDGYTPIKDVDYFDGEDGYTPIKGVDYFDGEDGYTPIKDVDYFDGLDGTNISSVTSNKVGKTTTVTVDGDFVGAPHTFDIKDGVDGTGAGDLISTNNLSDLSDIPTAVANLGLDTKMEQDGSDSAVIRLTYDDGSYIERDTSRLTWVFVDTDGTTANIPNELWYGEDKASEAILNGQMAQFAGVQGDHSLSKVAVPSEINANPYLLMGMATKDHANNEWTKLTEFGVVHDVNTNGWTAGTILYFDSVNGGLTNVKPTYPNAQIIVGAVLVASSTAGAIVVRRSVIQGANEVDVDESQFTGFLDGSTTTQEAFEVLDTHNHDDKQDTLVSGTNIKTINGDSVLGAGDLTVTGGQMLGTATVKAIAYNAQTIAENITILGTYNAMSVGPITIEDGYTVELLDGAVWVIV